MEWIWSKILEEAKNFTQKEPFLTSIIEQVIHDNNHF
ncbi:serine O-acetyltransferase [Aquimarina discodermiae]